MQGRGGLVVRSWFLGPKGYRYRNLIPLKIGRVLGPLHATSYVGAKRPPVSVAPKPGEVGASPGLVFAIRPRFKIARSVVRNNSSMIRIKICC
ncbi:hypothetical protein AVEN_208897-1 [Araneus ventricosus]|uniref:Uncharacterized protein n=1 Tax=Araneus ventricosus TaxID=182803 RepID=A0A4Y2F1S3_ARAVE|nr:hypothetical protein AVEN_208897-1 [Araneus ventricosus]